MSAPKFTPGPWRLGRLSDGRVVMADGADGEMVRVADCRAPEQHEAATEQANAALIAAAPDLYAALAEILDCPWVPDTAADHPKVGQFSVAVPRVEKARAALKKARGES